MSWLSGTVVLQFNIAMSTTTHAEEIGRLTATAVPRWLELLLLPKYAVGAAVVKLLDSADSGDMNTSMMCLRIEYRTYHF